MPHLSRSTTACVRASSSSRCSSPSRHARALASVVECEPPGSGRARRSRQPARARRRAGRPRAPARTTSSCCAASSSGIVGVPSRRSVPAIFPVSIVCAGAVEDVVGDLEGDAEREAVGAERGRRPSRRHAASNSFPVLSAQRSRYASTVVSGRASASAASPRRGRGRASRRARTSRPLPRRRSRRAPRTRGRRGSRRSRRAASGPKTDHAAGLPRRKWAPSIRSSWTSVAMCTSSTATPAAIDGSRPTGARERQSSGRRRLPPAASASSPTARDEARMRVPPRGASRSSTPSRYASRPGVSRIASIVAASRSSLTGLPECNATIPAASSRNRTFVEAVRARAASASASGRGNRRTLAGRYVYAEPPGSTLPSSGTTRSNQSRRTASSGAARLRDLEDREPAAGPEHPPQLARAPPRGRRRCGRRSRPSPRRTTRVLERKREHVALDPLDRRRLAPRPLEHPLGEVEPDDVARARAQRGDREVAGAAARVEHPVARAHRLLEP